MAHTRTGRVELQLADRNTGAISPQVTKAENATAVGDANKSDVLLRPVPQDLLDLAAAANREIHATRLAIDMTELKAGFADGRVIDDRQKTGRIGHDRPIKERLVMVEEIDQVDVAFEVGGLVTKLHHYST